MILDYEPLSKVFQDAGYAIRAGDPKLAHIDVSVLGFLAQRDLPPVELPPQCSPQEVATLKEETASSRLSFEAKINQFHFEEDKEERADPIIQLPDSEDELDRQSAAYFPKLIIARVDPSFEEDEEMDINTRKGLKGSPRCEEQRGVV